MDDLEKLQQWTAPLIASLSEQQRAKLARELSRKLRQSQARRIAAQTNPDGTPFEPRKKNVQERAQQRRGSVRNKMFNAMRTARFLIARSSSEGVEVGFIGRTARIANVHQYGLRALVQKGGPYYEYPQRALLGFTEEDIEMIGDTVLKHVDNAAK